MKRIIAGVIAAILAGTLLTACNESDADMASHNLSKA